MELSSVFQKLTHQETGEKEYFVALQIWEGGVKSALWLAAEGKTQVVALGSHETWEETSEDLVNAADASLATALERFPEQDQEPSKVIFGLPDDWVEGEKIVRSWQQGLQALCEKLELSPLGFVLTIDALNHHLKEIEGVPPSAILVNPQKNQVLVAVIERGEIISRELVSRSENLGADVYEGLSRRRQKDSFPSRILLFNGEDMEAARQILIDFPWQTKLSFLHLPKIEILPLDFDITSICLAGGSEVAKSLGLATEEKEGVEPEPDLGFRRGKDIREESRAPSQEAPVVTEEETEEEKSEEGLAEVAPEIEPATAAPPSPKRSLFSFFKEKISAVALPPLPGFPLRIIFLVIVFLLLGLGFVFLVWFLPKAQVVLYVAPKPLEKELTLTVDPNQEVVDKTNFLLPGRVIEAEISGEKTAMTTGKKTVGEKAKGEVTIFNTGTARTLAAGTILTGPGGLKFTLDQETAVSSGSAVDRAEIKAAITAAEIGAESNLAADSEFSLASLDKSVIGAKNSAALTGGTSRQIQAVSEEDQKSAMAVLTEELAAKGKEELLGSLSGGKRALEDQVTTKEISRNFDREVGEEAQDLNLSLKIKVSLPTFSEEDFFALVEEEIRDSIPEGYEARQEQIDSRFRVEKQEKDGSFSTRVSLSVNLLPKLKIAEIRENLKGKQKRVAQEYLDKLTGVVSAQIFLQPQLPEPISLMPKQEEKIELEIRSQ